MGRDKATLMLDGVSLLQRVIDTVSPLASEVIVVTRPGQVLTGVNSRVRVVEDVFRDKGPLAGVYTGLVTVTDFPALTVACDMPLLQPSLLRYLLRSAASYDAAVPTRNNLPEPLCAVYGSRCVDAIRSRIERTYLKMTDFLPDVRTWYVAEHEWQTVDPHGLSFFNVNTHHDLEAAHRYLTAGEVPMQPSENPATERA